MQKAENDWNPGTWVLTWVLISAYWVRAFQWIPTWQGLDEFQNSLVPFALDESSLIIGTLMLLVAANTKNLKNDCSLGICVLIWEYSARAFQWRPTWQDLGGCQESLRLCALDERSLSIGRVKGHFSHRKFNSFTLSSIKSVVCYSYTFENNLGIKQKFAQYLK